MDSDYLLITSKSIIHWVLKFFKYPFAFSIPNLPNLFAFTTEYQTHSEPSAPLSHRKSFSLFSPLHSYQNNCHPTPNSHSCSGFPPIISKKVIADILLPDFHIRKLPFFNPYTEACRQKALSSPSAEYRQSGPVQPIRPGPLYLPVSH